jgi:peptidoglycan hydrolase-like protein with peptidoglycan-binding domain
MDDLRIKNFDEFVKCLNESVELDSTDQTEEIEPTTNEPDVEEDKKAWTDKKAKYIMDDHKIKVVLGTPDTENGEILRYDFKMVDDADLDDNHAMLSALDVIYQQVTNMLADKTLPSTAVGFIETKRSGRRLAGDYLFKGIVSFYDASKFKNLSTAAVQPLKEIPIPTQAPATNPAQPIAGKVVEAEAPKAEATAIKIYDFAAMKELSAPGEAPTVDPEKLINNVTTTVTEPEKAAPTADATEKPTDQAKPTETTASEYEGLKRSLEVNDKVKGLQAKIIAKGGPAADILKSKGSADGKYGNMTAQAIGLIVNGDKTKQVNMIDKASSDKLVAFLADAQPATPSTAPTAPAPAKTATPTAPTAPAKAAPAMPVKPVAPKPPVAPGKPVKNVQTKAQDVPVLHF